MHSRGEWKYPFLVLKTKLLSDTSKPGKEMFDLIIENKQEPSCVSEIIA